jgi:hypothetical protein
MKSSLASAADALLEARRLHGLLMASQNVLIGKFGAAMAQNARMKSALMKLSAFEPETDFGKWVFETATEGLQDLSPEPEEPAALTSVNLAASGAGITTADLAMLNLTSSIEETK